MPILSSPSVFDQASALSVLYRTILSGGTESSHCPKAGLCDHV